MRPHKCGLLHLYADIQVYNQLSFHWLATESVKVR